MRTIKGVHVGDAGADGQPYGAWFVGSFVGRGLRRSTQLEVKYSAHTKPFRENGSTANRTATSLSICISGSCRYYFREGSKGAWRSVVLNRRGRYVMWRPGVFHSLCVPERCEMVVVRWPSAGRTDKIHGPDPAGRVGRPMRGSRT